MSKVIVLDIDGILCTPRSHIGNGKFGGMMEEFDPMCCGMLKQLLQKAPAKIVISSTWRLGITFNLEDFKNGNTKGQCEKQLRDQLNKHDLMQFLRDDWRTIENPSVSIDELFFRPHRGKEIKEWLDRHTDVDDYFILDDDSDMLSEQQPYFIKVESFNGFSWNDYRKIYDKWVRKDNEFVID